VVIANNLLKGKLGLHVDKQVAIQKSRQKKKQKMKL